jgi:hypothetical protein
MEKNRDLSGDCDISPDSGQTPDNTDMDLRANTADESVETRDYTLSNRYVYRRDRTGEYPDLPPRRLSIGDEPLTGVCPWCRRSDGVLNVFKESWAICHRHRARWCVGYNSAMFGPEGGENEERSLRNIQVLAGYAEVAPGQRLVPELPMAIEYALHVVLDRLWGETAAAYDTCPRGIRSHHLFRYMHDLDRWMNGEGPA